MMLSGDIGRLDDTADGAVSGGVLVSTLVADPRGRAVSDGGGVGLFKRRRMLILSSLKSVISEVSEPVLETRDGIGE